MVFLTLDAKSNGQTFFFKEKIPNPRFIRLVSCSLYNSWHTLKKRGAISHKVGNITEKELIRPGHYNEDGIVKMLQNAFSNHPLSISTHTPTHTLIIDKNENTAGFWFDEDLAKILNISPKEMADVHFVSRLDLPNSYYIHCDLVRKDLKLHNGEPSDILACIPISGNPQERVTYPQNFQNNSRNAESLQFVNSVTLTVKDENANDFDFLGLPMHFEFTLLLILIYFL